jgi:hypothetical protein
VAFVQRIEGAGQVHPTRARRVHDDLPAQELHRPDAAGLKQLKGIADIRVIHLQSSAHVS